MLQQRTRKIMMWNMKGGVAKTTTTINMGFGLANKGKKVLLVDLGFQNNIVDWLKIESDAKSLYDCTIGGKKGNILIKVTENLYIIRLVKDVSQTANIIQKNIHLGVFTDYLDELCTEYGFSYMLFDSAPEVTELHRKILDYADEIFVPVSMEYSALCGIIQVIKLLKEFDSKIEITKVIPTFIDKRYNRTREVLEMLKGYFKGKLFEGIRSCSKLSECHGFHQDIFTYAPNSTGAEDYEALVKEVLKDELQNLAG